MKAKPSSPLFAILAALLLITFAIEIVSVRYVDAQNCVQPDTTPRSTAFPQGRQITVHVNESQFSQAEFGCLQTAFNNWNAQNGNNFSGVTFNVTRSPTVLVTSNAAGQVTSGGTDVYQVNRSTDAVTGVAVTGGQGTTANRVNAFTNIHPNVTNCTALAQTMAHEIGHTLGLGECSACTVVQQSVMVGVPCLQRDANNNCISIDYNNTTYGLSGPTPCDNNAVHQSGYACTNHNVGACEGNGFTWDEYSCTCVTCYCNSPEHNSWCSEEEMRCTNDGRIFEWCQGLCTYYSPIVIDVAGNGFALTDANNGVFFDINGDSVPEGISWTAAGSDDAWLALDMNNDGRITSGKELFGNFTSQPDPPTGEEKNGFRAFSRV